jgi:hypothetical protein
MNRLSKRRVKAASQPGNNSELHDTGKNSKIRHSEQSLQSEVRFSIARFLRDESLFLFLAIGRPSFSRVVLGLAELDTNA